MTATARLTDVRQLATRPLRPEFGVEVLDLDIATASEPDLLGFDAVCRANPLVVIRDQHLDPPQLLALAGRLGRVSPQHRTGPHPEFPGISILSNKRVNGKLIGVPDAGRNWHTDGTTYAKLGLTTILYGIECPPEGADTCFADTTAAFAALPPARQAEIEKLAIVHNRAHLIRKYNRAVLTDDDVAKMQDMIHPMVITNPLNGRKNLFLTKGSAKAVVGLPDEGGLALINELIAHATQEQFVYRHKWRDNDVVIWNNLCTLHQATPFDEDRYERLVHRVWIRPFNTTDA